MNSKIVCHGQQIVSCIPFHEAPSIPFTFEPNAKVMCDDTC